MSSCHCTVEVTPEEVDAGGQISLKVRVESPRGDGLRDAHVSIRNQEGAEVMRGGLEKADDGAWEANGVVVPAPRAIGEHAYRAVVVTSDKAGALREQASAEVRFAVKSHAMQLTVWDVPPATVAGERFKIMAGVRCSAGCDLGGRELTIVDQAGAHAGTVKLRSDVWPGTEALYFAEIEARAPGEGGSHQWKIRVGEWDSELPHAAGSFSVGVRVVSPPDCEVTVSAIDREQQTPIAGARVVMHPYRAVTDEKGVAKIKVSRGQYDLLVSGSKYLPACASVEVTADMSTSAELDADQPDEVPE